MSRLATLKTESVSFCIAPSVFELELFDLADTVDIQIYHFLQCL